MTLNEQFTPPNAELDSVRFTSQRNQQVEDSNERPEIITSYDVLLRHQKGLIKIFGHGSEGIAGWLDIDEIGQIFDYTAHKYLQRPRAHQDIAQRDLNYWRLHLSGMTDMQIGTSAASNASVIKDNRKEMYRKMADLDIPIQLLVRKVAKDDVPSSLISATMLAKDTPEGRGLYAHDSPDGKISDVEVRKRNTAIRLFGAESKEVIGSLYESQVSIILGKLATRYIEKSQNKNRAIQRVVQLREYLLGASEQHMEDTFELPEHKIRSERSHLYASLRRVIAAAGGIDTFTQVSGQGIEDITLLHSSSTLLYVSASQPKSEPETEKRAIPESVELQPLILTVRREGDWRRSSACSTIDPEIFSTDDIHGDALVIANKRAKSVCNHCLVAEECLEDAIANDDRGIRGNATQRERNVIVRRRAARQAKLKKANV